MAQHPIPRDRLRSVRAGKQALLQPRGSRAARLQSIPSEAGSGSKDAARV